VSNALLPGVGTGDHAVWEFNEGQESIAHHRALAVMTRLRYQQLKHGLCMGYESKVSEQFLETSGTAPEKALLIWT